jgi:hypothetical protein
VRRCRPDGRADASPSPLVGAVTPIRVRSRWMPHRRVPAVSRTRTDHPTTPDAAGDPARRRLTSPSGGSRHAGASPATRRTSEISRPHRPIGRFARQAATAGRRRPRASVTEPGACPRFRHASGPGATSSCPDVTEAGLRPSSRRHGRLRGSAPVLPRPARDRATMHGSRADLHPGAPPRASPPRYPRRCLHPLPNSPRSEFGSGCRWIGPKQCAGPWPSPTPGASCRYGGSGCPTRCRASSPASRETLTGADLTRHRRPPATGQIRP